MLCGWVERRERGNYGNADGIERAEGERERGGREGRREGGTEGVNNSLLPPPLLSLSLSLPCSHVNLTATIIAPPSLYAALQLPSNPPPSQYWHCSPNSHVDIPNIIAMYIALSDLRPSLLFDAVIFTMCVSLWGRIPFSAVLGQLLAKPTWKTA